MAELVDAPASGAGAGNGVEVRVLFRAPLPWTSTLRGLSAQVPPRESFDGLHPPMGEVRALFRAPLP